MARLRKFIVPNQLHFVTTSVVEGLVFPPNELIKEILRSCIARAQELYPVTLCHFYVSTTHVHFMLMTTDPENIPGFMERFKTESAHAINKLLGVNRRTIWCDGYDSPLIYKDLDKAIEKIAYIYANPAKDGLEQSIDNYPGISTWGLTEDTTLKCSIIPRSRIRELPTRNARAYLRVLTKNARKGEIRVEPNAWMAAFGVPPSMVEAVNEKIKRAVRSMELEAADKRNGAPVIGRTKLINTKICSPFTPERTGKRTYVICGDVELRKTIISSINTVIGKAREVYHRWKIGDYSQRYPIGLFPPRMPRLASALNIEAALSARA